MADDKFEYTLKDEGGDFLGGPIKTPLPLAGNLGFIQKYKKFLIPIGIILAIIILYKLLNWFSSTSTEPQVPQQVAQKVETTPGVATPAPTVDQLMAQQSDATKQKMDSLTQQIQATQTAVATLNEAVNQNKNDLQTLKQSLDTLTAAVSDTNNNLQILTLSVKKPAKVKRAWYVKRKVIYYHVKAIVPGRVWLESSEGYAKSLKEGDRLEGYGRVKAIIPDQGIVIMSSGTEFKYGPNDH